MRKHHLLLCLIILLTNKQLYSQPTISSFTPKSGNIGTTVTISGTNFSSILPDNIVYFGAVKAEVLGSTSTSLTVTVPTGATYQPITVTVNGLTAYSSKPFGVTYSNGILTPGSFAFLDSLDEVLDTETNDLDGGDFDSDGKIDIAIVDRLNNQLLIFKNTSTRDSFSFSKPIGFSTGMQPVKLKCGDFDGDGKLDIIVTNSNDSTVSTFRNTSYAGVISFGNKIDFRTDVYPQDVVVSDFDGDGKPDIAVGNNTLDPGTINILRNNSSTGIISFATKTDVHTYYPGGRVAAEDFNGDNKPDIVSLSMAGNLIYIIPNTSSPGIVTFGMPVSYSTQMLSGGLTIGDLDGDDKSDIAFTNYYSNTISILRNTSTGNGSSISFEPKKYFTVQGPNDLAINDMDGDGKPEIVVRTQNPSGFTILQNNSSSNNISFGASYSFPCFGVDNVLLADWNGDGKTDIAVGGGIFRAWLWKNNTAGPQIISFDPPAAKAGEIVNINGANFTSVEQVSFGGIAAQSFTVNSSTSIKAVVDTGSSGEISVITSAGTAVKGGFTYSAQPVINSFTPQIAAEGTSVTITGKDFTGTSSVSFGGVTASFTLVNKTTIVAIVGSGSSGSVAVTTPFGTATKQGFLYIMPPVITSFSPGSTGTSGTISILGNNFLGTTAVSFGGVAARSFTVLSNSTIMAVVENGANGDVSVTTPFGIASLPGFTYIPPPVINSFTPAEAEYGTTITITGTNLGSVNEVIIGGKPALSFSIINDSTILANVGNGTSGDIIVSSPFGSSSLPGFTLIPPLSIDSIFPESGPIGTMVTITGHNFTNATNVYFGGEQATSFTVISSTIIQAIAGIGNNGSIQISTPKAFCISNAPFTFIYPQPTMTSFSPTKATTGDTVTITGSNFVKLQSISFGGFPAKNIFVISSNLIKAVVGAGGSGMVTLTAAGGNTQIDGFTFLQPPPTITDFYPSTAISGSFVAIKGENFLNTSEVKFGGINASSFVVNSNNSITAIVGNGATGSVTVTTPGGTVNSMGFHFDEPVITSFSPTSGPPGTEITILGSGFYNVWDVRIGGIKAASTKVNSLNSITAIVGAGNTGEVTVSTQSATARLGGFIFQSSTPYILSASPLIATAGSTIKISGYKFTGTTGISFGGVPAKSYQVISDSLITAVLGPCSSGDIVVNTPDGTVNYPGFIYTTAPVITTVSPESAPIGAIVTISGFNFSTQPSNNIVYFGSVKANVLASSPTTITVNVPRGAMYQPITVTTNGLTCYASRPFTVTFSSLGTMSASSFAPKNDTITESNPGDVTIADINADGLNDIAVARNYPTFDISLHRNLSTPSVISFSPKQLINNHNDPKQVLFGDLDGDGNLDMVVGNGNDVYGVSVYRNTSSGGNISFSDEYRIGGLKLAPFRIALGDLDGDGKVDIAVASQYTMEMYLLKNQSQKGQISFAAPMIKKYPEGYAAAISIADIDIDGKSDLILSTYGNIHIYRNTSTPSVFSFDPDINLPTLGSASSFAITDIDGDSLSDIVIANTHANVVSCFRNLSKPGHIDLANKVDFLSSIRPIDICVADMDGNNKPDLVIANDVNGTVSVFSNTSSNNFISFAPLFDLKTGNYPESVVVGDIDGDGRPDIVAANYNDGTLSILRNQIDGYFIASFSPTSGRTATVVTVKGSHFTGATAVYFGGEPATSFNVLNDTTLTAVIGTGKTGSVTVVTPGAQAALPGFAYISSQPTISSFTPTSGITGTSIVITGTNFNGATSVSFGNTPAQEFTVNSPTSITAVVGPGASGEVSVTTPHGVVNLPGFTFTVATGVGNVIANSKDLKVSPNPGIGIIRITHPVTMKNAKIKFVDILGRNVKDVSPLKNTKETMVDVSDLYRGVYQIIWSDGHKALSTTFLVQAH